MCARNTLYIALITTACIDESIADEVVAHFQRAVALEDEFPDKGMQTHHMHLHDAAHLLVIYTYIYVCICICLYIYMCIHTYIYYTCIYIYNTHTHI